jgi:hypothetical protein
MTKILKKNGVKIGLYFSIRDDYRSTRLLIFLCVFDADLRLCANGTFQSKLDQNDPYGSNLRKSRQRCIDKIFIFIFWLGILGLE